MLKESMFDAICAAELIGIDTTNTYKFDKIVAMTTKVQIVKEWKGALMEFCLCEIKKYGIQKIYI